MSSTAPEQTPATPSARNTSTAAAALTAVANARRVRYDLAKTAAAAASTTRATHTA